MKSQIFVLNQKIDDRIDRKEHAKMLEESNSLLNSLKSQFQENLAELNLNLETAQKEKNDLIFQNSVLTKKFSDVENEKKSLKETNKRLQVENEFVAERFEKAKAKIIELEGTMADLLKVSESLAKEVKQLKG